MSKVTEKRIEVPGPPCFESFISYLFKDIRGVSKVNRIDINPESETRTQASRENASVIVFHVDGKNYVTPEDGAVIVALFLRKYKRVHVETESFLKCKIQIFTMSELDPNFENESLSVIDTKAICGKLIEKIIKNSTKLTETASSSRNPHEASEIDFYDGSMEKITNPPTDANMFTDVVVSSSNDEFVYNKNECLGIQRNVIKKGQIANFQPFSEDWTNEMVDSVIGNMFEYESVKQNEDVEECKIPQAVEPCLDDTDILYFKDVRENQSLSRPFVCHFKSCNRAFKRFEHLKRHYRIHTGERPFKCKFPGCHKSFARSDNLNQHLRIHTSSVSTINHHGNRNIRYCDDNN